MSKVVTMPLKQCYLSMSASRLPCQQCVGSKLEASNLGLGDVMLIKTRIVPSYGLRHSCTLRAIPCE